ncbi:hypothetical protein BJ546DRAFT_946673 [Cryomyces antarcticus]
MGITSRQSRRSFSADAAATDRSGSGRRTPASSRSSVHENAESPLHPGQELVRQRRRSFVFGGRSRSETTTSTTSSFLSLVSTLAGTEHSSRRNSQDVRCADGGLVAPSAKLGSPTKSLFTRTRKSKRQSSQVSSGSDVQELGSGLDWGAFGHYVRVGRRLSQDIVNSRRPSISVPFDFRHLNYMQRRELPALDKSSQQELVAEFCAVRNSQRPRRELQGIRAEDLSSRKLSSDVSNAQEPSLMDPTTSPRSRRGSSEHQKWSFSSNTSPLAHRSIRSADTFSQYASKQHSPKSVKGTVTRPTRTSSVGALARKDSSVAASQSTIAPDLAKFGDGDASVAAPLLPTPGGTARQLMPLISPAYSTDLEDVPEEAEGYFAHRASIAKPDAAQYGSYLRQWQSFPLPSDRSQLRASYVSPTHPQQPSSRPMSQMSDTLGSPLSTVSSRMSVAPAKRSSAVQGGIDSSWEDDVDYCYEHEAEADCDFSWDLISKEQPAISSEKDGRQQALEIRSSPLFSEPSSFLNEDFEFSPAVHVSLDVGSQLTQEAMHKKVLADKNTDCLYASYLSDLKTKHSVAGSLAGDSARVSKTSSDDSYENLWRPSMGCSTVESRSYGSASSLPELVYNRGSPKETHAKNVPNHRLPGSVPSSSNDLRAVVQGAKGSSSRSSAATSIDRRKLPDIPVAPPRSHPSSSSTEAIR